MTPRLFVTNWKDNPRSERAGAQTFFNGLWEMLGSEPPNEPGNYTLERGRPELALDAAGPTCGNASASP